MHEEYINYRTNDVAILELAYPVNIDNFTRSICLGTKETLQEVMSQENPECYVTGFGRTEEYYSGTYCSVETAILESDSNAIP